uniref:(northern house mosquito) hypothetical protein n=1 Tax=Culex pipiens TaxID=7175 RepID=A0A8D8AVI0_CULPI
MMVPNTVRDRAPDPRVARTGSMLVQAPVAQIQLANFSQTLRYVHPLELLTGTHKVIRPLADPAWFAGLFCARCFDPLLLRFVDVYELFVVRPSASHLALVA